MWQAHCVLTLGTVALAALERWRLQGQNDSTRPGAQGFAVLLASDPSLQPRGFPFNLTSSTSRAGGHKLRLPDWAGLCEEGACRVLALYLGLEQEPRRVLIHTHWLPLLSLGAPDITAQGGRGQVGCTGQKTSGQ